MIFLRNVTVRDSCTIGVTVSNDGSFAIAWREGNDWSDWSDLNDTIAPGSSPRDC